MKEEHVPRFIRVKCVYGRGKRVFVHMFFICAFAKNYWQ
jgi:hypothetical protein